MKFETCEKCVGWCCYRFGVPVVADEKGCPDWDKAADLKLISKEDARFCAENFKVVPACPRLGNPELIRALREYDLHQFTFECTAWDPVTCMCTEYSERPYMCRRYVCDAQEQGLSPNKTDSWNRVQKRCMRRRGLKPKTFVARVSGLT